MSNHKFNEYNSCEYFIRELLNGKNIAVISDAGTPCISDPGAVLVRRAAENNIIVEGIPGACAVSTAVSISGFDAKTFSFMGFFPRETGDIKKILQTLKNNPGIYIFYESPKRIVKTFEIFAEHLESADICLCNDLTKKFERIYRGAPDKILAELRENKYAENGEYTLVISAAETPEIIKADISAEAALVEVMLKHDCTLKAAVKIAAAEYSLNKNEVYAASLNLKKIIRQQDTP